MTSVEVKSVNYLKWAFSTWEAYLYQAIFQKNQKKLNI